MDKYIFSMRAALRFISEEEKSFSLKVIYNGLFVIDCKVACF